jgi:hypothetical protein
MPIRKLRNRIAARKKKTTPAKKHVGDVLGLGTARPPRKPVKSAKKAKRRKGIEITRKRSRTHLRPARVRG